MNCFEASKRLYEKEKQNFGHSLILRNDYGKRGYRYWFIKCNNNETKGMMITQDNVIIAIEVKQKLKGYGRKLIQFCQQKMNSDLLVEYPTEESINFYNKVGVKISINLFQ